MKQSNQPLPVGSDDITWHSYPVVDESKNCPDNMFLGAGQDRAEYSTSPCRPAPDCPILKALKRKYTVELELNSYYKDER
jgi:hypothetical protein